MSDLADRIRGGDARATARGISLVENDPEAAAALVRELSASSRGALTVGVTGAAGVGKSTLVDALIRRWRAAGRRVGVIAVDPTSPFSGGAMLGDRVRMQAHACDAAVFIRSMATRGHAGGLARATADAAVVLDAAGYDPVVLETVGVGQAEIDVVRTADVTVVVLIPGMGDDVQAMKAGVMEIADVFVVNKAHRAGTDRVIAEVEAVLDAGVPGADGWRPPVLRTEAVAGEGVDALVDAIDRCHRREDLMSARRSARAQRRLDTQR